MYQGEPGVKVNDWGRLFQIVRRGKGLHRSLCAPGASGVDVDTSHVPKRTRVAYDNIRG